MAIQKLDFLVCNRNWIGITFVIICVMVLDASIEDIFVPDFRVRASSSSVLVYVLLTLFFILIQLLIIRFAHHLKVKNLQTGIWSRLNWTMAIGQLFIIAINVIIIIEMTLGHRYDIYLIHIMLFTSQGLSIFFLGTLAYKFFSWFRRNRNLIVLFYTVTIILLLLNAGFTLLYLSSGFRNKPLFITPFRDPLGAYSSSEGTIRFGYLVSSVISFILIWITTVLLLYHYSNRVGKAKYWFMVSIPLLYFILQFQGLFINSLQGFRLEYPILFNTAFTLIFNSINPVGGILFGIAFWIIARNMNNNPLSSYLIASSIGIMLLFGTKQATSVISLPYPPFGIPSMSFAGQASYLILIGIYYAALSVANDDKLRQIIRKSVQGDAKLLQSIANSEQEEKFAKRVFELRYAWKTDLEKMEVEPSLDDTEIRNYVRDVIREVRQSKNEQN